MSEKQRLGRIFRYLSWNLVGVQKITSLRIPWFETDGEYRGMKQERKRVPISFLCYY